MKFFIFILLSASLVAAEPLGYLGDTEINVEEIRSSLEHLDAGQADAVRKDPKVLEQVVRGVLVQKLVLKEALEKKWEQQPAIVAKLNRVRDSTLTETYLESVAEPAADYPSEAELKSAYEANKSNLLQPRSFRLAQIFISSSGGEAKLAGVKKALYVKNADFSAIATGQSEDAVSASRGGEIGWLTEAQIQPEIRSKITGLKVFTISEPIRLDDGWHILKVLDSREPYTPTLEQVRAQLIRQLRTEKLRTNSQAHLAKLLQEHPLTLNASALTKLLPPLKP